MVTQPALGLPAHLNLGPRWSRARSEKRRSTARPRKGSLRQASSRCSGQREIFLRQYRQPNPTLPAMNSSSGSSQPRVSPKPTAVRLLPAFASIIIVLAFALTGYAQTDPISAYVQRDIASIVDAKKSFSTGEKKLSSHLAFASRQAQGKSGGKAAAAFIDPPGRSRPRRRPEGCDQRSRASAQLLAGICPPAAALSMSYRREMIGSKRACPWPNSKLWPPGRT